MLFRRLSYMVLYIRYFCSTLHTTYLSCMPVTNDILNLKYRFYSLLTLSKYFSALLIFFLNFLFFSKSMSNMLWKSVLMHLCFMPLILLDIEIKGGRVSFGRENSFVFVFYFFNFLVWFSRVFVFSFLV